MSFSLVDRITELVPGERARGSLRPVPGQPALPPSLLIEAVGQLAAQVTMQASDFSMRPVAATAGEVRVLADAAPGETIGLEVEIQSRRSGAVGYCGRARQGGMTLVSLERAVGALLPMAELDDPERAREELALLLGAGRPARSLVSPAELRTPPRILEQGAHQIVAEIRAPEASALYAEHFPRRPVYPATLLLDAQIALAVELLAKNRPSTPRLALVRNVKVRAFTPPGGLLSIEIRCQREQEGRAVVALAASAAGGRVSSAVAELALENDSRR